MKRQGSLFNSITSWDNLLEAAHKAAKGKRGRPNVVRFDRRLMDELYLLRTELREGSYRPGPYRSFYIDERKKRLISAAPFRDRVVHHALCNVIMPIFEKMFIETSFANRMGKGTHRGVLQCREYLRRYPWYLQCDVRNYFPSIDHAILKKLLARKIKCNRTLDLIGLIVDGSNAQKPVYDYYPDDDLFTPYNRRRGLPIGNLTSQYFANIYLNPLDRFVTQTLGFHGYIRYVDDFLLFGETKQELHAAKAEIVRFLQSLRLRLHENRAQPRPSEGGITFLGYRVSTTSIRVRRDNPIRARRRIGRLHRALEAGRIAPERYCASIAAWRGHVLIARHRGLLRSLRLLTS